MSETIRVKTELLERITRKFSGYPAWDAMDRDRAISELHVILSQPAEQQDEVNRYYIMGSAVIPMSDGEPCYTPLTNHKTEIHTVPLVMASNYDALQSELNEKRETIMRLLSELDAVPKIPCVSAMAKALSDKHADEAGVNRADTWKQYSHEYIEDVEYMLATCAACLPH